MLPRSIGPTCTSRRVAGECPSTCGGMQGFVVPDRKDGTIAGSEVLDPSALLQSDLLADAGLCGEGSRARHERVGSGRQLRLTFSSASGSP
jgi:hypothetical protein